MKHTSINYEQEGIPCTANGSPICSLDNKDCDVNICRYHVPYPELGNCVLRLEKGRQHTLQEIADIFGITREGVRVIETRALKKLFANNAEACHEILREIVRLGLR